MKLNRGLLAAVVATFVVGSVAVVGCTRSDDEGDDAQLAPTEQAAASGAEAANAGAGDVGVEQYARGGGFHGGAARGGWGHAGWGGRGWDRGGWARGGRWDWRRDHRYYPWW